MKKFKSAFLIAISALCLLALPACKTTTNPSGVVSVGGHPIDPQATGKAIQIAAKYGALETIRQKPETRIYFQLSAGAISAVIASGNYSSTNLVNSLDSVTGNKDVSIAISDALSLYQDFFGTLVADKLEGQSPYTVPALTGLAVGIQQAVELAAP